MATREMLLRHGLRAYERGRFLFALRIALVLVPLITLCALATGEAEHCACLGVLLLGLAVFMRFRSRAGAASVREGLVAGSVPLALGLLVSVIAPECAAAPLVSMCTLTCTLVGAAAGYVLVRRAPEARVSDVLVSVGIASLAASLGCVGLGVAGIAGATFGLAIGRWMRRAV